MKKVIWFSGIIILIEIIAAVILLPLLPEQIPMHWNVSGEIDRYGAKWLIFLAPAISLAVTALMTFSAGRGEGVRYGKAFTIMLTSINLLFSAIFLITVAVSFDMPVSAGKIISALIGIMFVGIGNYLPKVKQNFWFGIKLPWTYASETVWAKTHRVGGWAFMLSGALFIAGTFLPPPVNFVLPLSGMLISLAATSVYSYMVYKKQI